MPVKPAHLLQHLRRLGVTPAAGSASDAVLLGRFVRQRDEAAFAELVARYGPMVLRTCRRVLADTHDAEEAFQATFLVLARKAASVRPPEALAAWLHEVARRAALKARAARSRRCQRERPPLATEPPDPHADPLAELCVRELLTVLDEEVRRLPEVYRLPVLLCCVEGRTQEEAARQLGWSHGSVRGRLMRGRARLHARLVRRGLTLSAGLLALEVLRGTATAAVAARLGDAVLRAACSPGAGDVSHGAFVLAEGVVRNMMLTKLKSLALVVLLVGAVVLSGGLLARHALAGCFPRPAPAADEPMPEDRPVTESAPGLEEPRGRPLADAWSKPLRGMSARLRVAFAPERDGARHETTVEFKNVSSADALDVSNRFRVEARLFDDTGMEIKWQDPTDGSAAVVPRQWVQVPLHAYVGFPADLRALGIELGRPGVPSGKGTTLLALGERDWVLKPGRYTARARLTIDRSEAPLPGGLRPPPNQVEGRIELHPVEFTVSGPQIGAGAAPRRATPPRTGESYNPAKLQLTFPKEITLDPTLVQQGPWTATIERLGFVGPVTLHFKGLPPGVIVQDAPMPAHVCTTGVLVHHTEPGALPKGRTTATITARGGGMEARQEFVVIVGEAEEPHLELIAPGRVNLVPGGSSSVQVQVRRRGFSGLVKLCVVGLPDGVRVSGLEDAGAAEPQQARFGLEAGSQAPEGEKEVTVLATAKKGTITGEAKVRLRVARRPAAFDPSAEVHDLDRLQGNWSAFWICAHGQGMSAEAVKKLDLELVIEGNRFRWLRAGEKHPISGTLSLDESSSPRAMDFVNGTQPAPADTPEPKTVTLHAIYQLGDKGTLQINAGKDKRPTDFTVGSDRELMVFRRSRP
jgi:RNA polymerase sigma factor (sigma-70 family)